jgi:23S rRNA-intervening sequence protein
MKIYFDHEKLDVYQESIAFCGWVGEFLAAISAKAAAKDQLDRASTSIPLNIAEGTESSLPGIERDFSRWHVGRRLSVRHAWTFFLCESSPVRIKSFRQKKGSRESSRCSSDYFESSLSVRPFYAKRKWDIQSITITSRSRSTSNNDEACTS